jgi:hypothetical protein
MSVIIAQPFGAAIAEDVIRQSGSEATKPYFGITLKGGAFHRTSDQWLVGGVDGAPKSSGILGIALEARRVNGFLIGIGVDRTLSRWSVTESYDGDTRQRITSWSLNGTLGVPIWRPIESESEGWIAFEAGKLWASEEKTLDGIALHSSGSGSVLRFKFIGTHDISRHFSIGFETGWQVSSPAIEYKWFDEIAGDSLAANDNLKLSGPLLEARVMISGP